MIVIKFNWHYFHFEQNERKVNVKVFVRNFKGKLSSSSSFVVGMKIFLYVLWKEDGMRFRGPVVVVDVVVDAAAAVSACEWKETRMRWDERWNRIEGGRSWKVTRTLNVILFNLCFWKRCRNVEWRKWEQGRWWEWEWEIEKKKT